jgi:hypothetical protein
VAAAEGIAAERERLLVFKMQLELGSDWILGLAVELCPMRYRELPKHWG